MDTRNSSYRILIVDDNPHNLQVLGGLLMECGYSIEFATNGKAAIVWIEKQAFDLVLLDINMPGMSGFEVCRNIRERETLVRMPIIFVSAESDRENMLKGFELGAQDYITKPFDSRELLSRVKTHLNLKDTLEHLEQLNKTLEEKVEERTEELKDALEQVRITNLKLLDLDKAKSEFLHLISHEIRTPLNGIVGPMEIIKQVADTQEIEEIVSILDMSVKRLERFAYNALLITRLKTMPSEITRHDIDVMKIITKLLVEPDHLTRVKKVNIRTSVREEIPVIKGEEGLIKECFSNILINAINYSPEGGNIDIGISDGGNWVTCTFSDSGPGFREGAEKEIFEAFSMGDSKKDNAPGMGLAISKLIMDAHKGTISIGNNESGGALVTLKFPAYS